jgi:hypothetical protein
MDAIEDGMYQPAMKARMEELVQQKAEIEARFADAPADLPDVHPNIAEHSRAKVIRLAETLAEPESSGEAREDIRSLVGEVVITPGDKRGESHAILRGELMAILDLATGRRRYPKTEVITNALACPRFKPTNLRRSGLMPIAYSPFMVDILSRPRVERTLGTEVTTTAGSPLRAKDTWLRPRCSYKHL